MITSDGKESSELYYSLVRCQSSFYTAQLTLRYDKNKAMPCPKCGYETSETKTLSMSTRTHKYGRQGQALPDEDDYDDDGKLNNTTLGSLG